ncbi:MAG: hypothetical protein EWV55_23605 [Microcystis viridis Mv_BB_P_19951000_S69]|uniref:Uncharacterized protein n=1 Tax=Microcystis viridis Mv_BB_P_19951000_S68D TaxID=2486270 RepID=A0A552HDZ5_MICVR|nr:MAG: hypothetical protein EWV55_23605 [Microcystis viridis Mv_BB_P_19951000_S69]TRU69396.1 MAG: hypothetical protein EWV77_18700 [Microcystis viridis Mv_BB_P_19951000_S68D]TRU79183.1 MAG: hypothetical protein EWV47_00425 [Microcystis viridis Mv_BB_P_19951000_S68]TRU85683.1 MAG: hypothetical protein EWV46_12075 [Microcystis viridis Mv_BB_P_19951000_S69D]
MTILQAWLQNLQARFQNRNNQNALPHAGVSLEDLKKLNPEQAKIILEYEKLKEDNHWSKPFLTFVAGALIPMFLLMPQIIQKQQEIQNLEEQAKKNIQKDIYGIFLTNRTVIYSTNPSECENFAHITDAVYHGSEDLGPIFNRLAANVNATKCQSILWQLAEQQPNSNQQPSPEDKQQAQEQATSISKLKSDKVTIQIEDLIKKFTTSERKTASLTLSELANKDPEAKPLVVNALIGGIVGDNDNKENPYLKNLYIAYTLGKIKDWSSPQYQKVCNLKTSKNYNDPTFKMRVNNAINKLDKSQHCP